MNPVYYGMIDLDLGVDSLVYRMERYEEPVDVRGSEVSYETSRSTADLSLRNGHHDNDPDDLPTWAAPSNGSIPSPAGDCQVRSNKVFVGFLSFHC